MQDRTTTPPDATRTGKPTPTRQSRKAEQQAAAESNRAWHDQRAAAAEKRRKEAAEAKRKAAPSGGRSRALALVERLFGETPVTHQAVQMVDRDRSGRPVPHRNAAKDRSLRGKSRIRARKADRR